MSRLILTRSRYLLIFVSYTVCLLELFKLVIRICYCQTQVLTQNQVNHYIKVTKQQLLGCCHQCSRGRVVKALDLKSNGVSPRRFESCRMRTFSRSTMGVCKK